MVISCRSILFAKIFVNKQEKLSNSIYSGVPLEVEIRIYVSQQLDYGNNVPIDFQLKGMSNGEIQISEGTRIENSYRYQTISLKTNVVPFQIGEVGGKAIVKISISNNTRNSIFKSYDTKTLEVNLPTINVSSLPPVASDSFFLNLIGVWEVETSLNKQEVKVGELVEYKFTITGTGDVDRLQTSLEPLFEGFQSYKTERKVSELDDRRTRVELTLPIIPQSSLSKISSKKLATFNTETLQYDYFPMVGDLKIKPDSTIPELIKESPTNPVSLKEEVSKEKAEVGKKPSRNNKFVFTRELLIYIVISLCVVVLVYLLFFKLVLPKKLLKRKFIRKKKKLLIKKLSKINDDNDYNNFIRQDLVEFLINLYNLDNGLCAEEIIEHCRDEEIVDILNSTKKYFLNSNSTQNKEKLLQLIKKLN